MTAFDSDRPSADQRGSDADPWPSVPEREALIEVRINGDRREIPPGFTVDDLLSHLKIGVGKVAVERNRSIVQKSQYDSTPVEAGDIIEIVSFMGGG